MRLASPRRWLAAMAVLCLMASTATAQTPKKKADTTASFRVLTGTITEVASGMATVEIGKAEAASKKAGQEWKLAFGKPTLVLRAGKNGQYATIEVDEIKKSDVIQAVVEIKANPDDRSHAALWLVVYPSGTTPPSR